MYLCRVYENGEVDVCIPPNIPEQIMSKVEACQERMKHDYAFRTGNSTPRDLYPPRSARGRSTSPPLRHRVTDATIAHLRDRVQALGVEASHARKLHHEPQPERLGVKPLNHKSLSRSPPPPTTPMVAEKDTAPDRYTAAALRQTTTGSTLARRSAGTTPRATALAAIAQSGRARATRGCIRQRCGRSSKSLRRRRSS